MLTVLSGLKGEGFKGGGVRVLLTGATGFVGSAIVKSISDSSCHDLIVSSRQPDSSFDASIKNFVIGDINSDCNWRAALDGVDVVLHAAARAHIMRDSASDPLIEFRRVNTAGTLHLARQAAEAGVRRFVFVSSIKVNGEATSEKSPFTEEDPPSPQDPYGVSKLEAEQGLLALARETGMEVVIVRPPLVYGPGVKANFRSMMSWLKRGIPLPLGSVHNKRSFVALDNLVDFVVTCMDHPRAANQVFLVSDGVDLSVTELLTGLANAMGQSVRLLPVPVGLLKAGASLLGKRDVSQRLLGSLQLDISKAREVLGWVPPVSVEDALKKTAADFLANDQR